MFPLVRTRNIDHSSLKLEETTYFDESPPRAGRGRWVPCFTLAVLVRWSLAHLPASVWRHSCQLSTYARQLMVACKPEATTTSTPCFERRKHHSFFVTPTLVPHCACERLATCVHNTCVCMVHTISQLLCSNCVGYTKHDRLCAVPYPWRRLLVATHMTRSTESGFRWPTSLPFFFGCVLVWP